MDKIETSRRTFLAGAGATVMAGAAASAAAAPGRKMRGIYPIAQTPCTADNKLDLNLLAERPCQQLAHAGDHAIRFDDFGLEWLTTGKGEQTLGESGCPVCAVLGGVDVAAKIGFAARKAPF